MSSPRRDLQSVSNGPPDMNQSRRDRKFGALNDTDLLAGLWQEAPFVRLPLDAPSELQDLVQDIDNPRYVYAIHRARRRHDFQLLVDKYVYQLRNGCGSDMCSTSTCLSCRKRLAGSTPIRRYNPTSARTLAVYLASQDSPEDGLCPILRRSTEPPPACHNLMFSATPRTPTHTERHRGDNQCTADAAPPKSKIASKRAIPPPSGRPRHVVHNRVPWSESSEARNSAHSSKTQCESTVPSLSVAEGPATKDHRSFAANMFGSVAFKMLGWLTAPSVSRIAAETSGLTQPQHEKSRTEVQEESLGVKKPFLQNSTTNVAKEPDNVYGDPAMMSEGDRRPEEATKQRQRSKTGTSLASVVGDHKVIEPVILSTEGDEPARTKKSSHVNGFQTERKIRPSRKLGSLLSSGVPEIPTKPVFFENVPAASPPLSQSITSERSKRVDSIDQETLNRDLAPAVNHENSERMSITPTQSQPDVPTSRIKCLLPQALRRLDVDLVDFICNTFHEDLTLEQPLFGPSEADGAYSEPLGRPKKLVRRQTLRDHVARRRWHAFNEQTIFAVLSNPASLVVSFTTDGQLFDSHTLWYCMLRLMRVAPSLVLHSLWIACESLFTAPRSIQSASSPAAKVLRKSQASISNSEAGSIMAICMHALVAAAPVVMDSMALFELSRMRAKGRTHNGNGPSARQPPAICLAYDDAFSNGLALRLAKRLFSAITTRQAFAKLAASDPSTKTTAQDSDILWPLLGHFDALGTGADRRVLEFPQADRRLHGVRVPILLLDWAKAVLLQEWNGQPDFLTDGSFNGALALMAALHKNKRDLLLGDLHFRLDYVSDYLDSIEMPIAWLSFTSSTRRRHILDYPFMLSPDMRVNYFRSINFARMGRMFEESSSLKARMRAIVEPGSLITDPHHKTVLQDLLRTASAKYLVLDIRRDAVLRDAFDQLWRRQQRELLRPLKVHLGEEAGEEGFDSGGVQQEFFRMAIAECLDPIYGAFTIEDRTRMAWFVPGSPVETWKYELVGVLVSLAVYNGLTLPITFPKALYRKLLGKPVKALHHIADGWPDLASGLTVLSFWDEKDGLVEDVFARTYEFSVSTFGSPVTRHMTTKAGSWPQTLSETAASMGPSENSLADAPFVTGDNRDEYIDEYIRYLTDVSVRPQFTAFERGFHTCLDSKSLTLLNAQMLQSIVEGVQDIDISELRRYARYVGWDASHRTVKDFWSIVKKYDDEMKRKLLEFVTASDRVPVGGMRNLQFVVQKNGEEMGPGGHLPTAYTCYGTLLLPEYKDKEALRDRLGMALANPQGFGFA